jgi:hypothetical protein
MADAPGLDEEVRTLRCTPSSGGASGMWWGDLMPDQRALDGFALVFDSEPLTGDLEVLGFPRAHLRAAADAPLANWFVRLGDVAPDGRVTLVAGGGLSGAQAVGSRTEPRSLEPGREYDLEVELHVTSWVFPRGHRIRLAVSNAMWPMIWPTPYPMTTTLRVGGDRGARVVLPMVPFEDRPRPPFVAPEPPVPAPGWRSEGDVLPGDWHIERNGSVVTVRWGGSSWAEAPWGRATYRESLEWRVDDDDPAHASVHGESETGLRTGEREIRWFGALDISSDETSFDYRYRRELELNGERIRDREWHEAIPRDHQ